MSNKYMWDCYKNIGCNLTNYLALYLNNSFEAIFNSTIVKYRGISNHLIFIKSFKCWGGLDGNCLYASNN